MENGKLALAAYRVNRMRRGGRKACPRPVLHPDPEPSLTPPTALRPVASRLRPPGPPPGPETHEGLAVPPGGEPLRGGHAGHPRNLSLSLHHR